MVARKHPSWGPPIDKDSAHHAHPLRTALSSRLRGAVVTVPASHGWGPGSNPMACTFHFFKIGRGLGLAGVCQGSTSAPSSAGTSNVVDNVGREAPLTNRAAGGSGGAAAPPAAG